MEFFFAKIVNKFQPLTIVAKNTSLQILGKMMFEYIFKKKKKIKKMKIFCFKFWKQSLKQHRKMTHTTFYILVLVFFYNDLLHQIPIEHFYWVVTELLTR